MVWVPQVYELYCSVWQFMQSVVNIVTLRECDSSSLTFDSGSSPLRLPDSDPSSPQLTPPLYSEDINELAPLDSAPDSEFHSQSAYHTPRPSQKAARSFSDRDTMTPEMSFPAQNPQKSEVGKKQQPPEPTWHKPWPHHEGEESTSSGHDRADLVVNFNRADFSEWSDAPQRSRQSNNSTEGDGVQNSTRNRLLIDSAKVVYSIGRFAGYNGPKAPQPPRVSSHFPASSAENINSNFSSRSSRSMNTSPAFAAKRGGVSGASPFIASPFIAAAAADNIMNFYRRSEASLDHESRPVIPNNQAAEFYSSGSSSEEVGAPASPTEANEFAWVPPAQSTTSRAASSILGNCLEVDQCSPELMVSDPSSAQVGWSPPQVDPAPVSAFGGYIYNT